MSVAIDGYLKKRTKNTSVLVRTMTTSSATRAILYTHLWVCSWLPHWPTTGASKTGEQRGLHVEPSLRAAS